jgi:hypothetical protein
MQNKIEQLAERINALRDMMGEINFEDIAKKQLSTSTVFKERISSISDIIIKLQKEISENDSITLKEVHKKFEELSPLLNVERLTSEFTVTENEMYSMILANYEEIESFLANLKFINENQKILDYDPIVDLETKIQTIKKHELDCITQSTNIYQTHDSIDQLAIAYSESISNVNEKLYNFNRLIDALEVLNK